jgi:hypothetical protein
MNPATPALYAGALKHELADPTRGLLPGLAGRRHYRIPRFEAIAGVFQDLSAHKLPLIK